MIDDPAPVSSLGRKKRSPSRSPPSRSPMDNSHRPAFQYRSVKHRRKSDGLFQFTASLGVSGAVDIATGTATGTATAAATQPQHPSQHQQSIDSIEKTTKARILNTIADAIHARRSLFGATISNVRRAFAAFDQNGDGVISQEEFRSGMRRLGTCFLVVVVVVSFGGGVVCMYVCCSMGLALTLLFVVVVCFWQI